MPTPTTSIQYLSTLTRYFSPDCVFLLSSFFSLQETYLSADDLRINLWHMEITDQSFNIVDIKPANMEELTEVKFASLRRTLEGLVLISVALSGHHCLGVPPQGVQSLCLLVQQGNE